MKKQTIERRKLIYVGDEMKELTQNASCIYEAKTLERSDWAKVMNSLDKGIQISIRPATVKEKKKLIAIINQQWQDNSGLN